MPKHSRFQLMSASDMDLVALEKGALNLEFPAYISAKVDGIRCAEYNGVPHTRSLKQIRNNHIRGVLTEFFAEVKNDLGIVGIDGELACGEINDPNLMQKTSSGVMSAQGTPDFTFHIFDSYQHQAKPFEERYAIIKRLRGYAVKYPIAILPHLRVSDSEELLKWEKSFVEDGLEGAMYRKASGHYKMGRSSNREMGLLKMKRFVSSEAIILEVHPLYHNGNEATLNELGYTQRLGSKDNLVPLEMLGKVIVKDPKYEKPFSIGMGPGLTHDLRKKLWETRESLPGKLITYSSFDHGVKDVPRFPKWISIRDPDDYIKGRV